MNLCTGKTLSYIETALGLEYGWLLDIQHYWCRYKKTQSFPVMVYSNYETPNVYPEIIGSGIIESSRQVIKDATACHRHVRMHYLLLSKCILHMIIAK